MDIDRVVDKIRNNDVVLWAGSGYSLYAGKPSAQKLIKKIKEMCTGEEVNYLNTLSSLSQIASAFINMRQRSKNELYKIIQSEVKINAEKTWVHDLLTEIPQLTTIITTNYDTFFENIDVDPIIKNRRRINMTKRPRRSFTGRILGTDCSITSVR